MENEPRTRPSAETREQDRNDSHLSADAGKMPTSEEELAADAAEDELVEEGVMKEVAENYREMTRIGAEQKGEGRI